MTSKFVPVGGGRGGGDDETLDKGKKKRYHNCYNRVDCRRYHMDRTTRTHIPLMKMDGVEYLK